MELRSYLDALRLRWWLVAGLAVLGALAGLVAFLLTAPVYASAVTFYVSVPPVAGGSSATATQFAQAKVSSYVALVKSEEVARRVIADQRLDATPAAVALAWVRYRKGVASTLVGARRLDQLEANLAGLDLVLTEAQIAGLDMVSTPALNFPADVNSRLGPVLGFPGTTIDGRTLPQSPMLAASAARY